MLIKTNVKYLREKQNLSKRQLSILTKIPYTVVCQLESGLTKDPRISTLSKLSNFFGVSLDQLVKTDICSQDEHSK